MGNLFELITHFLHNWSNCKNLFQNFWIKVISCLPNFLIYGALKFQQLDAMPALKAIMRNLCLTSCAFWTPRLPFLDSVALALPPFRCRISHRHPPIVCFAKFFGFSHERKQYQMTWPSCSTTWALSDIGLLDKGYMARILQFNQSRDGCPTLSLRFQGKTQIDLKVF